MTSGQLVPKRLLLEQIHHTVSRGESRVFTILTDKKRSIMFRFSEGRLIHSHCRSRKVDDAITALDESTELKFSVSESLPKDQPELLSGRALLRALEIDNTSEPEELFTTHQRSLQERVSIPTISRPIDPALESSFRDIARDYIGMVANILVADVFRKQLSFEATVDGIAASIPVSEHADAFRQRATQLINGD